MERGSRLTFKAALFVMLFCIAAAAAVYIFQYKSGMNLSSEAAVPESLRVWYTDEGKTSADVTLPEHRQKLVEMIQKLEKQ